MWTPRTVYVTYITAPPDRVWAALTTPAFTEQYFFGRRVESDWQPGSTFSLYKPDGELDVQGTVVESAPPRRLSVTWRVMWHPDLRALPENLVTYDIEDLGGVVRFTVTESYDYDISEEMLAGGRRGWPIICSSLKSLLETGHPLPAFDMSR